MQEVADFSLQEPAGRLAVAASWMRICRAGEGLHRISDVKPTSRNTKTPHAAVIAFPVDERNFERQVRLLQLKMLLQVELVQRRVREQANRQCKLRVVREQVQIQPALSERPGRLQRMIV